MLTSKRIRFRVFPQKRLPGTDVSWPGTDRRLPHSCLLSGVKSRGGSALNVGTALTVAGPITRDFHCGHCQPVCGNGDLTITERFLRSFRGSKSIRIGLQAVLVPGLAGSLLLSLATARLFQLSWLRPLYDTPIPWVLAVTVWLLPRAVLVRLLAGSHSTR